jgi:putative ABC transport system substrate-binding protein
LLPSKALPNSPKTQVPPPKTFKVAIIQLVTHPSLDEISLHTTQYLKNSFGKNIDLRSYNAQGDMSVASQIIQTVLLDQFDAVIPITTPIAKMIIAKKPSIPVIFSAVNDPISAKLVSSDGKRFSSLTGVIHFNPVEEQVEYILKVLPQLKSLGVLYSEGEDNSHHVVSQLKEACDKKKIQLVPKSISKSADITSATSALSQKVQGIYIPTDNTVVSALGSVVRVSKQHKIPLFSADVASVKEGALLGLGLNHPSIGKMTGQLTEEILKGKDPLSIPLATPKDLELHINMHIAQALSINLPKDLVEKAHTVYK